MNATDRVWRVYVTTPDRTLPAQPGCVLHDKAFADAVADQLTAKAERNGWRLSYTVAKDQPK